MAQDPSNRVDRPQLVCPQCGANVPLGASSQPIPVGACTHRRGVLEPFEQQLWRAQRMEAASKLAGGIAQHFNQLLLGILGASRLAARNLGDHDAALPYLAEIAAAADRGAELTRTLLAFGRPHQPQLRPLRLAEALQTTRAILREIVGAGVKLEIEAPAHDVWIFADPEQIEHVLVNLTLNARDAMHG